MEILNDPVPAVAVADFKRARHMAVDVSDDDLVIEAALGAAEALVLAATGRPVTPHEIRFELPAGWCRWWVPVLPVTGLLTVQAQDAAGVWTDQALEGVVLRDAFSAPVVELSDDWTGHASDALRFRVTVSAGYDAKPLPQLRQAIILLAQEWYDAGISVEKQDALSLSFGAVRLIRQVRYRRVQDYAWRA